MLIYLDANVVQYCADNEDFIFGDKPASSINDGKLLRELTALRRLVEIEQLGTGWAFAAPFHLMNELLAGIPRPNQRRVYNILLQAWIDLGWQDSAATSEDRISSIVDSLHSLNLKDNADKRHVAEAIVLGASWFLTNDRNIVNRTRLKPELVGSVQGVRIARPSECVEEISTGKFLK
jgi:hypothetical protein